MRKRKHITNPMTGKRYPIQPHAKARRRVRGLWAETPPCQHVTVVPGGYYDDRSTLAVTKAIRDYMASPEGKRGKEG